jgi:DNA-3-methyladenine glycosylase
MYGPPGFAYVYLIYGMHHCLNVVTEPEPMPAAVLIRAVEPIAALGDASTAGPGRLCRAFGITRKENGVDLTGSPLCILPGTPPRHIATSPRVGVAYAGECATWPWRFFDPDSPCVSRTRPSVVR